MSETQTQDDEAQAQRDFDEGAAMDQPPAKKPAAEPVADKPEPKPEPKPEVVKDPPPPAPKHVRITEDQFNAFNASAAEVSSLKQQMSKAFGTIGGMQRTIETFKAQTPQGLKVAIPDDAFAGLEKDFPELATHMKSALEASLKGVTGTGSSQAEIDPERFEKAVRDAAIKVERDALEDVYPDWHSIVGAVAEGEKPDPNNQFRKWLATKDAPYQTRLNNTQSAAVISRAISRFQEETKVSTPQAPRLDPKAQQRAERLAAAVQPKGDGGQSKPANSDNDDFESGFKTG